MPRFDNEWRDQQWHRHGLESVYSILNKPSGSHLNHFNLINDFCDLLNIIFGNSDNHGRNTSFIKSAGQISLAPIYDFAPMKADTEVVTRSTTWVSPYEEGGEYRWDLITQQLAHLCDPRLSLGTLKFLAVKLLALKERLIQRGVPEQIIKTSVLSFDYIEAKLKRWDLL